MDLKPINPSTLTPPPNEIDATVNHRRSPRIGEPVSCIHHVKTSFPGTMAFDGADFGIPKPHDIIGAYRIVAEVGAGGMGVVYEAIDQRLKRRVAIKMIRGGVGVSRDAVRRFQNEAEAVAQTQHPNIVQIHEVGWHEGQPFVALEFLSGGSLHAKAANKPQSPHEAAELVQIIAEAMHHAHTQGVIHRDLKPANILFAADGTPKVTDFGAARLNQDGPDSHAPGLPLTQVGEVIGTPQYMAPEQARGTPGGMTALVDVYALGAVLYHLLTGRPPHDGPDAYDVLSAVLKTDPLSPRRLVPKVPRDLETICLKALEKHPGNRYATAKEMADDLGRFLAGDSILAKPDPVVLRLWRKARRKPVISGLIAGILIVSIAGLAGGIWQWRQALIARDQANEVRNIAVEQSRLKDQSLYRARVAAIALLLDKGDYERARHLLDDYSNPVADQPDLRQWEWHFLNRLGNNYCWKTDLVSPTLPASWTHKIAVSPDAKLIAYSVGNPYLDHGFDQYVPATLYLMDAESGEMKYVWPNYLPECAVQLVWRDAESIIASTPHFGCRVFHVHTGNVLWQQGAESRSPLRDGLRYFNISPDGKYVFRMSDARTIVVCETNEGQPVRTLDFTEPVQVIPKVSFVGSEWRLVAATSTHCYVFNPATWHQELRMTDVMPERVAFDAQFRHLAVLDNRGDKASLQVWSMESGNRMWNLPRPAISENCILGFSPDGDKLGEVSNAGVCVRVFDTAAGLLDFELRGHTNRILDFRFSPDGRQIATASNDSSVRVWSLSEGTDVVRLRGHTTGARVLAFDPNGWRLYTGGMDMQAFAFDLTRERTDGTRLPHTIGTWGGAFAGGLWCPADGFGRYLDTSDSKLLIFDPDTYTPRNVVILEGLNRRGEKTSADFALSEDARFLFGPSVLAGPMPCVWDAQTGKVVRRFEDVTGRIIAAALNHDGSIAAAVTYEGPPGQVVRQFYIWNTLTGERICHRVFDEYAYGSLAFDAAGRLLCGVMTQNNPDENGIHILDVTTHSVTRMPFGRPTRIRYITLSPGDRWLATIDHQNDPDGVRIDVRDFKADRAVWTRTRFGVATGLAFSPDGKRLAATCYDDTLTLFDVESNLEVFSKQVPSSRNGDYAFPARAAFSPDGRSLIMNNASGQISIWRTDSRTPDRLDRTREARSAVYAYHLRAARELSRDKDSIGFRFHAEWLDKLPPPNPYIAKVWAELR